MSNDAYKQGQNYAQQHPQAEKPTPQQIPNYDQRIAFTNGMDSQKK